MEPNPGSLQSFFDASGMTTWNLESLQPELRALGLDGWLLYDFRGSNPMAVQASGLPATGTRRWFLWVPAQGAAELLVHAIEAGTFTHFNPSLQANLHTYVGWLDLHQALARLLAHASNIAMEYSPGNAIPYVDKVDAGMLELVRTAGQVRVQSSADLVQKFQAVLTADQIRSHHQAAQAVLRVKDEAFALVGDRLRSGESLDELGLQRFIVERLEHYDLDPDHDPIVAVNAHAADPHYEPTPADAVPILPGDMLLLDIWGRPRSAADSCFADVTWTGYCGPDVPSGIDRVFQVVRRARDAALRFMREGIGRGETVYGYAVDDACRQVMIESGHGDHFIHRTGHSLGTELHFSGVNIDNLETQDYRALIPGVMFTIEPGIYMPDWEFGDAQGRRGLGIRSEVNCLVHPHALEVTTLPLQNEIIPLLA